MKSLTSLSTPKLLITFVLILFMIQVNAQTKESKKSIVIHPNDVEQWNTAPDFFPGCEFTVLHGDLESPRLDFLFKIEPNTEVVKHTHNSAERMILISGELEVQYDGEEATVLTPGTYAFGPAGKPHKAKCQSSEPCVLFVAMNEPFDAVPK